MKSKKRYVIPSGSVPAVARKTQIPERTIYQYIQQGKIQANKKTTKYGGKVFDLGPEAIEALKRIREVKEFREAVFEVAQEKGKSQEAVKKWLQRNRDLPKADFNQRLCKWLEIDSVDIF